MKRVIVALAAAAALTALLFGRPFLATGQQPRAEPAPVVIPSHPAHNTPPVLPDDMRATTPPGDVRPATTTNPALPGDVRPASATAAPGDAAPASLPELLQQLQAVRQKKAEVRREEQRISEAIRRKLEEEKALQEKVKQLLDSPEEDGGPTRTRP